MKKKILSMFLAATMIIGATTTVSADFTPNTAVSTDTSVSGIVAGHEVSGTTAMSLPTIKVTVPTALNVVINPYKIEYKNKTVSTMKGSDQIVCLEQTIKNESDVAVEVNVKDLKVTEVSKDNDKDAITISATPITDKDTDKKVFLYMEVQPKATAFEAAYNKSSVNQIVIPYVKEGDTKTKVGEKDKIVELGVGSTTATEAKFKIGGNVVVNPTKMDTDTKKPVSNPWTESDMVTLSVKFTFTPIAATAGGSGN